jgi:hypothetical protein
MEFMLSNAGREAKPGIGMTERSKDRSPHAPVAFMNKEGNQPSKRRPRRFGTL